MDTRQDNRHVAGVVILAIMIIACAWLIPINNASAATEADGFNVRLTVADSIQTRIGQIPSSITSSGRINQVVTGFVTRAVPATGLISEKVGSFSAFTQLFTTSFGNNLIIGNDEITGTTMSNAFEPAAEIVVTISSL
ncbi:MAG: hypothetical protein ACYCXF_05710 [Thermoleophilia bacterium]